MYNAFLATLQKPNMTFQRKPGKRPARQDDVFAPSQRHADQHAMLNMQCYGKYLEMHWTFLQICLCLYGETKHRDLHSLCCLVRTPTQKTSMAPCLHIRYRSRRSRDGEANPSPTM